MNSSTMQKVKCLCLFDITATAVNGHQRNIQYPYTTRNGTVIDNALSLSRARNQQRNFDTLLQLIGMRTQVFDVTDPILIETVPEQFAWAGQQVRVWEFEFEVEPNSQWSVDNDQFWILKNDSDLTPMITGLGESAVLDPWICTQGPRINTIYHA